MNNKADILNELKELSAVVASIGKVNVFTVPEGYFGQLSSSILMGIQHEEGHLTDGSYLSPSDVPAGYFDSLSNSILNKIKTLELEDALAEIKMLSAILADVRHKSVFEIPDGYFDTLSDSVMMKIKTSDGDNVATELRILSPMLYSIQNENVFEVPRGYFENLSDEVLEKAKPQPKVVAMKTRTSAFFKYAVAAAFTGVMALGVFKFTGSSNDSVLPDYVTIGMHIDDLNAEFDKLSNADIVNYLESNGTDVKAALVANSVDKNELPTQEDYLFDEKALDDYLNSINLDNLKN